MQIQSKAEKARNLAYGIVYSTVRWGSAFFERTFGALSKAIEWVDRQGDLNV